MSNLYATVIEQHDWRFVAVAVAICGLGCLTGVAVGQHALKPENQESRSRWLLLAGMVTGLAIWTTHFTAMLGYRQDLDIRFDLGAALVSMFLAVLIATAGWLGGFRRRKHGVLAGVAIGLSICIAHFVDMLALRVSGTVNHDHILGSAAVALGLGMGAISGRLFAAGEGKRFAWPAALALTTAVVLVHFTAMAGVTIIADDTIIDQGGFTASYDQLSAMVVGTFFILLATAVAFTWRSVKIARETFERQRRLIAALEELRRTQDHHRAYVELNPQIAWVADTQGRVTEMAPLWEQLTGLPREMGIGEGWASVIHPDDLPAVMGMWQEAIATGDSERADARYRIRLVDGSYRWFRVRARPRRDEKRAIIAWYGSLEDIHDQVVAETALRASEERYRLASRATNDVIWDWSFEEQRARWAGAYEKVLGYPELEGRTDLNWWLDRIHPEDLPRVRASQQVALAGGCDYWNEEYRFLISSGDWIDVKTSCVIVRNGDGAASRLVGSMLDITQQKKAESELQWAAHHDQMTGLPNRALYQLRLRAAIDAAHLSGRYVALMVLDLNSFKELNDTLGHAAGDEVLVVTAKRLSDNLPEGATAARLGGDEFAVILPGLSTPDAYREPAARLCETLVAPFAFEDLRIPISYGAGVAIWPRDADDPGELLIAADLALYAAKAEMPGALEEFSPALKDASKRRSKMLATARAGLTQDRIVPYYQPKVDLRSGRIMGWEALLRIIGAQGEVIPPSEIEAAFTDADMTVQLTDRMFARVFADLASWRPEGIDPGRIAVNVSAGDFRQKALDKRLLSHAQAHGLTLSLIDIEVTEGVLIGQLGPEVSRMLEELRTLGVMVALDDFGTGYASLTHLQQFPVDVIKIDKTFIERISDNDPKATAVIDAVLQMARRLGMQTVAEGIETMEQAQYLRARGCTIGQGYFFSRPMAASDVRRMLASQCFDQWEFGS